VSCFPTQEVQVVAVVIQVLQGEVQAAQTPPEAKYPAKHPEQAVALVQEEHPVGQAVQVFTELAVVIMYPLAQAPAVQVVVVPEVIEQVEQFDGQATQALLLAMYPEIHAVQVVVDVQVVQLDKQAVQVGAVPKNPTAKQALQAVPVKVAHPVGKAVQALFIN